MASSHLAMGQGPYQKQQQRINDLLSKHRTEIKNKISESVAKHCRSDPNSVSTYILALLGKNKSRQELMEMCHLKLKIFFHDHTPGVVDILFNIFDEYNVFENNNIVEKSEYDPQDMNKLHSIAFEEDSTELSENNNSFVKINWNSCPNIDSKTGECTYGSDCAYDHETLPSQEFISSTSNNSKYKHDSKIPIIGNLSKNRTFRLNIDRNLKQLPKRSASYKTVEKSKNNNNHLIKNDKKNSFVIRNIDKDTNVLSDFYPNKFAFNAESQIPFDLKDCNATLLWKIPQELNKKHILYNYFSKFGNILKIEPNYKGDTSKALICFNDNCSAYKVFKSNQAIFNNRFIKVRLIKIDKENFGEHFLETGKNSDVVMVPFLDEELKDAESGENNELKKQEIIEERASALLNAQQVIDIEKRKIQVFKELSKYSIILLKQLSKDSLDSLMKKELNTKLQETLITLEKIKSEIGIKSGRTINNKTEAPVKRKPKYLPDKNTISLDNRNKTIILRKDLMMIDTTHKDCVDDGASLDIPNNILFSFFKRFGQIHNIIQNPDKTVEIEYAKRSFAERAIMCGMFIYNQMQIPIEWNKTQGSLLNDKSSCITKNAIQTNSIPKKDDLNTFNVNEKIKNDHVDYIDGMDPLDDQNIKNNNSKNDLNSTHYYKASVDQEFDDDIEITV